LIPAGTGIAKYRNVEVNPTEEARAAAFSMAGYDESDYYGFSNANGAMGPAVPLDDYGYDDYR
jgi:DNA-directed RNA polymerase subunit beta'